MDLKAYIRNVKDFPKQGIMFRDITTLLKSPEATSYALEALLGAAEGLKVTKVAGIESRGFIFGAQLASRLGCGFVPIRKPNKLPAEKISVSYDLEYGKDIIEMHTDAIHAGDRVLLHDDLLATGGTARAACSLIEQAGGQVVQVSFLIELTFLNGRKHFPNYSVFSAVAYQSEE